MNSGDKTASGGDREERQQSDLDWLREVTKDSEQQLRELLARETEGTEEWWRAWREATKDDEERLKLLLAKDAEKVNQWIEELKAEADRSQEALLAWLKAEAEQSGAES